MKLTRRAKVVLTISLAGGILLSIVILGPNLRSAIRFRKDPVLNWWSMPTGIFHDRDRNEPGWATSSQRSDR